MGFLNKIKAARTFFFVLSELLFFKSKNFKLIKVDKNFNNIDDIANYLRIINNLKHKSSVLIFNKVPKEKAIDKNLIESWIDLSINKAKTKNIIGKDLTPYLISEINSLSQNKSLEANTALIVNNSGSPGQHPTQISSAIEIHIFNFLFILFFNFKI